MALKLTSQQRRYVKKHGTWHELDPSELPGELNIIPFLDIVVNLIMFLLMVTSSIAFYSQVEAALPTFSRGGVGSRSQEGQALNLNLTLTTNGMIVSGAGGKLAPGCTTTATGRVVTVPNLPNGDFNFDGLTDCVALVKQQFQDETRVTVSADPLVEYQDLISAMDAVRSKDSEELFPEVLLSAGVR